MKTFMFSLVALCASIGYGGTISNVAGVGLTRVTVDQPYGQFTKLALDGGSLVDMPAGDTFYTDAASVWITDLNGYGSLHTFDYSLAPLNWIVVRPSYGPEGNYQEFGYEYAKGATRWEIGPMNLAYGLANVGSVPEPSTLGMAMVGLLLLHSIMVKSNGIQTQA